MRISRLCMAAAEKATGGSEEAALTPVGITVTGVAIFFDGLENPEYILEKQWKILPYFADFLSISLPCRPSSSSATSL